MSDKISGLTDMTAAKFDDLGVAVDVHDDTMASTGTDKRLTLAQEYEAGADVVNLLAEGVDNTGATDATSTLTSIFAAIASAAPATVYVDMPVGNILISGGFTVPSNARFAGRGATGGTVTGVLNGSVFRLSGSYDGTTYPYVFLLADPGHDNTNGALMSGFAVDGSAYTAQPVDAIRITGPCMTTLDRLRLVQMSGWGINGLPDMSAGEIGPFGALHTHLSLDSCVSGGFKATYMEDSTLFDVYSIGHGGPAFQLCGMDNSKLIACRGEWSQYGFWFTNDTTYSLDWTYALGGCQVIGCSTDRNSEHGVLVDATWTPASGAGTGPCILKFTSMFNRRDGGANSGATGSYAGFFLNGTNLIVDADLDQMTGIGDGGGGGGAPGTNQSPRYGVSVSNLGAAPAVIRGIAWGMSAGVTTSGTVTNLNTTGVLQLTGISSAYTA